jgi:hypothetical protein
MGHESEAKTKKRHFELLAFAELEELQANQIPDATRLDDRQRAGV